jgi:hypothetical protein
VRRVHNQRSDTSNGGSQVQPVNSEVRDQGSKDTQRTNGGTATPHTTMEASRGKQAEGMLERSFGVGNTLFVTDVVDQDGSHDSVRCFLLGVEMRWKNHNIRGP